MSFGQCQKCKAYFTQQEYNARIGNNVGLCFKCIPILKQQRDALLVASQAIVDYATEQVNSGMVSFKQTSVLIRIKLITEAKTAIANCEA